MAMPASSKITRLLQGAWLRPFLFLLLLIVGWDVAIRTRPPADPAIARRLLGAPPALLCATAAYLEQHGAPERPDDLRSHDLLTPERRAQLEQKTTMGYAALGVMEQHLAARMFFVDERYSIADIALYAYTHVAAEGGFDLTPYPSIGAWLERVRRQPRHIPITQRG